MAQRKKIGILLFDGESYAGGYYYVLNAIRALNILEQQEKPSIVLFYTDENILKPVYEIKYPFIEFKPIYSSLSFAARAVNKFTKSLLRKSFLSAKPYPKDMVEFVFPYNYLAEYTSLKNLKKIYWVPDFQHLFYPEFFSKEILDKRNNKVKEISEKEDTLVLSSESAFNDYKQHYPSYKNKVRILHFTSIIPSLSEIDWEKLKAKFSITNDYFFVPNQFWKHKNHLIVLKAMALLASKNIHIQVLFSGKDNDPRDKEYVDSLKQFIRENNIEKQVKFLGFIDRKEQLKILQNALAVIQPSLFEGWSTVVEDSKALNQFVIASNLNVHKEQLKQNCFFFDATNHKELADILANYLEKPPLKINIDYDKNIRDYALRLKDLTRT